MNDLKNEIINELSRYHAPHHLPFLPPPTEQLPPPQEATQTIHIPAHSVNYIDGYFLCACGQYNSLFSWSHRGTDRLYLCAKCGKNCEVSEQVLNHDWLERYDCDDLATANNKAGYHYFSEDNQRNFKTKLYDYPLWSDFFGGFLVLASSLNYDKTRHYHMLLIRLDGSIETSFLPDEYRRFNTLQQLRKFANELSEL